MNWRTVLRHALLVAAVVAGVVGMGMVFNGAMAGSIHDLSRGVPFLLIGLWWAGHELGRSMDAARHRRSLATRSAPASPSAAPKLDTDV